MATSPAKRGRPALAPEDRKRNLTMRLSPDVIDLIRAAGPERVEAALRKGLV